MPHAHEKIRSALARLKSAPTDGGDVLAIVREIESETAAATGLDPRLGHYLENRSYDKALAFLDGQQPCGHSHHGH